jgi:DNA-binding transcriptional MerR regulator
MSATDDVTLTIAEAAVWVGKPPSTIRRWVAAGHLVPRARDRNGADLYRMSDLCRLDRDSRRGELRRRAQLGRKLTA